MGKNGVQLRLFDKNEYWQYRQHESQSAKKEEKNIDFAEREGFKLEIPLERVKPLRYNKIYLQSRGFNFVDREDFSITDLDYCPLIYAEVDGAEAVESKKRQLQNVMPFAATWIFVRSTEAVYVTRPAGETRVFVFNPRWSHRTEYVKGKIDLLEKQFNSNNFDELFDTKAVQNRFYEQLWEIRLDLAKNLKKNQDLTDKDAILLAQKIFDRIIFLYFCCESEIITKVTSQGEKIPTSGKEFFNSLLRNPDIISKNLNTVFFDFFAKPHLTQFQIDNQSFDIPYLNGGLFQAGCYTSAKNIVFTDQDLIYSDFNFRDLFSLLNNFLWVIDSRTPRSPTGDGVEINGTLTPEILGHVYEKFVITVANLDRLESDSFALENLRQLIKSKKGNKRIGAYYTPEDVVQFIIERSLFPNVLGRLKLESKFSHIEHCLTFEEFFEKNKVNSGLLEKFSDLLLTSKILDPAVGSGHFLLGVANEIYKKAKLCNPLLDDYELKRDIIVNCVYGVDLMPGAVEICKLRLWLWLISSKSKKTDQPPLPNLEFNIRCGNSLFGLSDISKIPDNLVSNIQSFSKDVNNYKNSPDITGDILRNLLLKYEKSHNSLDDTYSKEIHQTLDHVDVPSQLFHWVLDFFAIFNKPSNFQGFDLIIGNPPYGDLLQDNEKSILGSLGFLKTNEIFANFIERESYLLKSGGFLAQIFGGNLVHNSDLTKTRNFIRQNFKEFKLAYFGIRPSRIFDDVDERTCIGIGQKKDQESQELGKIMTTKVIFFRKDERKNIFKNIEFADATPFIFGSKIGVENSRVHYLPKIGSQKTTCILAHLKKIVTESDPNWTSIKEVDLKASSSPVDRQFKLIYRTSARYWINAVYEYPNKNTTNIRCLSFCSNLSRNFAILLLNSNLFYLFYAVYGDQRTLRSVFVSEFPFPQEVLLSPFNDQINSLAEGLCQNMMQNYDYNKMEFRTGFAKPIIAEAEGIIGKIFGFDGDLIKYILEYDNHIRK